MTIDQALEIIKQSEECLIVWRTDTGEIIKVENLDKKVSPENFLEHLSLMPSNLNEKESGKLIQYASGFRTSKDIDKQYLEKERDEYLKMDLRVKIINQWTEQLVGELISILETQDFPYPIDEDDIYILLERIFDFHSQELGETELKRLWRLVKNENLAEKDKILLEFHLLFFEWKKEEFVELYKGVFFMNPLRWVSRYVDYYIGDLQIADKFVLKNYHQLLKNPQVLFGAKYPAMIALGKIGNDSGEESAKIIEKVIYDSEEYIIKARNLVLKRIRTPASDWERCPKCYFGRVQGSYGDMVTMQDCADCAGLGWIEKQ